ncbi:MAG: flap endonuclease-1, partial [Nitrososphaerales archaeon]
GELSGKTIAIDAYNTLYQFLAVIRGAAGEPLKDRHGRVTSHLSGLFYRSVNLMEKGIDLIYVFDGRPPELKSQEISKRRMIKERAQHNYEAALGRGNLVEAKKFAQATSRLSQDMIQDSKQLLDMMGIPWVQAPSEGEAQAAHMASKGQVFMAASQDHDALLFGAPNLLRNLTITGKRKLPNKNIYVNVDTERINLNQALSNLGLTREQLVDLGILLGTDFNPDGFDRIGPITALKLMKKYGSFDSIPDLQKDRINVEEIRDIFLKPQVFDVETPKQGHLMETSLTDFLCKERGFSQERVESVINKFRIQSSTRSENLEKWFG